MDMLFAIAWFLIAQCTLGTASRVSAVRIGGTFVAYWPRSANEATPGFKGYQIQVNNRTIMYLPPSAQEGKCPVKAPPSCKTKYSLTVVNNTTLKFTIRNVSDKDSGEYWKNTKAHGVAIAEDTDPIVLTTTKEEASTPRTPTSSCTPLTSGPTSGSNTMGRSGFCPLAITILLVIANC